jgi:hypothetical protein
MNQKERSISSIVMVEGVKPRRELMFMLSPFSLQDSFPGALYVNKLGCYCRMCHLKYIQNYNSIMQGYRWYQHNKTDEMLFIFLVIYGILVADA